MQMLRTAYEDYFQSGLRNGFDDTYETIGCIIGEFYLYCA